MQTMRRNPARKPKTASTRSHASMPQQVLSLPDSAKCLKFSIMALLLASLWLPREAMSHPAPSGDKAREPYALIFGTVWGPDDRPLYGVKVKIRRAADKKARWELYSDHRGEFAQRVPAGNQQYVIWADVKGYKLMNAGKLQGGPEVTVQVDNDERQDVGLHLK